MEQNSLISKMKPYELATLAARMCPGMCVKSPARAIVAAERLLQKAREAIDLAHQEDEPETPRADWIFALKAITGQKRRDRAVTRFLKFVERESPKVKQQLDLFMRDGFPVDYMIAYQEGFKKWLKAQSNNIVTNGFEVKGHC